MILVVETGTEYVDESTVFGPFDSVKDATSFVERQKGGWLQYLNTEQNYSGCNFHTIPNDNHLYDGDTQIIWWDICILVDPKEREGGAN